MKIVVGCPVYERGWILEQWFDSVLEVFAGVRNRVEPYFLLAYTDSQDNTLDIIKRYGAHWVSFNRGTHGVDRDWTNPDRIATMAEIRNVLLDYVADVDAEYYLSLDSDITLVGGRVLPVGTELFPRATGFHVQLAADRSITSAFVRRKDGWYTRVKPDYWGRVDVICAAKLIPIEMVRNPKVRYAYHRRGEDFAWSEAATDAGFGLSVSGRVGTKHHMVQGRAPYGVWDQASITVMTDA